MAKNTFKCPNCKKTVEITQAIIHEFEEEAKDKFDSDLKIAVSEAEEKLKIKFSEEGKTEFKDLKKQLQESKEKNEEFREQELKLREEKRKLEQKEKDLEITTQRKIDEERKGIEEKVSQEEEKKYRLEKLEWEKQKADMQKSLEEAQRKGKQGSQQTQGEVLELDFEEALRKAFPTDEIIPIEKGKTGADIRQVVKTQRGNACGIILWETKRTKGWSNDWPEKLKKDLRSEKANVPIIVTNSFPRGFNSMMGLHEGVWLVDYSLSMTIAELVRQGLIDVAKEKFLASNKEGKQEQLYDYVTSHEFVQQIESILEVRNTIVGQIDKERAAFEKQWKIRAEAADKLLKGTARMIGSIQGRLGSTTHMQIKGLDMLELDGGDED